MYARLWRIWFLCAGGLLLGTCHLLAGCSARFPNGTALAFGEPLMERAALSGGSVVEAEAIASTRALNRALALCPLLPPRVQAQCLVSQL